MNNQFQDPAFHLNAVEEGLAAAGGAAGLAPPSPTRAEKRLVSVCGVGWGGCDGDARVCRERVRRRGPQGAGAARARARASGRDGSNPLPETDATGPCEPRARARHYHSKQRLPATFSQGHEVAAVAHVPLADLEIDLGGGGGWCRGGAVGTYPSLVHMAEKATGAPSSAHAFSPRLSPGGCGAVGLARCH